jgi:hypothetical protein
MAWEMAFAAAWVDPDFPEYTIKLTLFIKLPFQVPEILDRRNLFAKWD